MVNAESLLVSQLNLDSSIQAEAFMDVPSNRPVQFVTVERTGGGRNTHRDLPQLAVQAWGRSRWEASELASRVADALERIRFHPEVARLNVGSSYNFPSADGKPRYQIVVDMVTKS